MCLKESKSIRMDMNFLEYPLWVASCNTLKTVSFKSVSPKGVYRLSASDVVDKLPTRTDILLLYYIVLLSLKNDSDVIEFKKYKACKYLYGNAGSVQYRRLEKSLFRLRHTIVDFFGNFYENKKYITRSFSMVDFFEIGDKIRVRIGKEFLEQLKRTEYFKYINIEEYKKLRKPTSARLYEILIKSFIRNDSYSIDIYKLRDKLTLAEQYPSHILLKIKSATKEINKRTKLQIRYTYNAERKVITFTKTNNNNNNDNDIEGIYKDAEGVEYRVYEVANDIIAMRVKDNISARISKSTLHNWKKLS